MILLKLADRFPLAEITHHVLNPYRVIMEVLYFRVVINMC